MTPTPGSAAVDSFASEGFDEASGEAALGRIKPRLDRQGTAPAMPTFNVRRAASVALGLVRAVDELALRPRLQKLAGLGEFDGTALERLPDLARAGWFLRHQLDRAAALGSGAQLPEALVMAAQEARARMLRVLGFHFEDHEAIGPELVLIRRGTGYQDLADDLVALARLYKANHAALRSGTPLHYRHADEAEAARLAAQIVAELGKALTPAGSRERFALLARVATALAEAYEEVAAAGRYLCRKQPEVAMRFPSLHAAARSRGRRTPDEPPAPAPTPGDPAAPR